MNKKDCLDLKLYFEKYIKLEGEKEILSPSFMYSEKNQQINQEQEEILGYIKEILKNLE